MSAFKAQTVHPQINVEHILTMLAVHNHILASIQGAVSKCILTGAATSRLHGSVMNVQKTTCIRGQPALVIGLKELAVPSAETIRCVSTTLWVPELHGIQLTGTWHALEHQSRGRLQNWQRLTAQGSFIAVNSP